MIRNTALSLVLLVLSALPASAQTFSVTAVELRKDDGKVLIESELTRTYFNRAKCQCARPLRVTLRIIPDISGADKDRISVVVGTGTCINTNDGSITTDSCRVLFTDFVYNLRSDIDVAISEGEEESREPTVADLMLDRCTEDLAVNLYIFKGLDNALTDITPTPVTFSADGLQPTSPTSDKAPEPGEGIVSVHFTSGSDTEPNARYQVLCERVDNNAPGLTNPPSAGYEVTDPECISVATTDGGVVADGGVDGAGVVDAGVADAGVDGALTDAVPDDAVPDDAVPDDGATTDTLTDTTTPAADAVAEMTTDTTADTTDNTPATGITALDPRFVCSEASPSDGELTVKGLDNNVPYRFYVVAIDEHENASAPILLGEATPVLAEDLWERYKRSGGSATGGFCAVGSRGSASAMVLAGLPLFGLLLFGLIRRRRAGR
ncbi:MAG: hypothetical protein JRH20_11575 [Deltaproteobacteria bacterium]|nr:hypothetical protein [Deltaproteobacteria bacterium]